MVDARNGLLTQTFRHSYIVSLMGIRHVVLAVNKMDAVDWDQRIFDDIATSYRKLAAGIGLADVICIPISALRGDNVTSRSAACPGTPGRRCSSISKRSKSRPTVQQSHFACRSSGSIGPIRISAGIAGRSRAVSCGPVIASSCCHRANHADRAHRHNGR